nr:LOW QUALITY PROTEIN: zinc finger protein 75D-like [Dasypus novemcinctus]
MMTEDLKFAAYLSIQIRALWEVKGSVNQGSTQKKNTPQLDSLDPESSQQLFQSLHYHEASAPLEAVSQLQELCWRLLRPEIHSKEQILEMLVLELFLAMLPKEIWTHVQTNHLQSTEEAVALVENFKRKFDQVKNEAMSREQRQYSWKEQQRPQSLRRSQQNPNQWVCARKKNFGIPVGVHQEQLCLNPQQHVHVHEKGEVFPKND